MKQVLCFMTLLFIAFSGELFAQYTVQIRFSQVTRSSNQTEWRVVLSADVFDSDNNLVPESIADQYLYDWYKDDCDGEGYSHHISGIGLNPFTQQGMWDKTPLQPDCCGEDCFFSSWMIKVQVEIDGQWYISDEVRVPDNGLDNILPRDTIVVDQKRSNNSTDGYIGRGYAQGIFNYPAPDTFYNRAGQSEIFKASQQLFTSPNEKYNRWQNVNDVVNHRPFTITSSQPDLVGQLGPVYAAIVQTEFITLNQDNVGYVEFKDPWLVLEGDPNYYDPPYGYRNLGMAGAALEQYSQLPLQLLTTNVFKGVFGIKNLIRSTQIFLITQLPPRISRSTASPIFWSIGAPAAQSLRTPPPEPPR